MPSIRNHVTTADGTDLLVRHWPADEVEAGGPWAGRPWASALLVHGLGEHSGRYEHVGDQLAGAGIDTYAYDQRGNGGSAGRRGHVDRWSQLHDDLAERLAAVRTTAAGRPVVLWGHSVGGLVAAGYLLSDRPKPDLAVLTSPALDSALPGWKKAVARFSSRVAPTMTLSNDFDPSTLSRDPTVGSKAMADPASAKVTTTRFGAEALAEQVRVRRDAGGGFGIPMLVLHGLDDGLVPATASDVLEGLPGVERRTYPDLRHELHNEPEGPAIIDEAIAWIHDRASERDTLRAQPNTASGERLAR
jgi:alpha-beta hydrolase superfamily lysophospholipase